MGSALFLGLICIFVAGLSVGPTRGQGVIEDRDAAHSPERPQDEICCPTLVVRDEHHHHHQPQTVFTTFTYFTTRFIEGSPVINSRHETVTNVIQKTVNVPEVSLTRTSERDHVHPTDDSLVTHRTTFTYFTTRFVGGTAVVSTRKETVTNVESNAFIRPTRVTVTKTLRGSPTRAFTGRPFVVVTRRPTIPAQVVPTVSPTLAARDDHGLDHDHGHGHHGPPERAIEPTPVTYFTTYTYFTTELLDGHPIVKSRESVFSTVIRGKILPTRVPATGASVRQKRGIFYTRDSEQDLMMEDSMFDPSYMDIEMERHVNLIHQNVIGSIEDSALEQRGPLATGLISSLSLPVPGTSSQVVQSSSPSSSSASSSTSSTSTPNTGLVSSLINTEVNEGITTLHTTEIYGTFVGTIYAHVGKTRSRIVSTPNLSSISKTLNTFINDGTTTVVTTVIEPTFIDGVFAHVGRVSSSIFEPSPVMSKETPSPVSVSHSEEVLSDILTLHTTQIFKTTIDGYPAHFTRTTANIIGPVTANGSNATSTEVIEATTFTEAIQATTSQSVSKISIHFPSPVRGRKKLTVNSVPKSTTITASPTTTLDLVSSSTLPEVTDSILNITDSPPTSDSRNDYYDETGNEAGVSSGPGVDTAASSSGHDYEEGADYHDNADHEHGDQGPGYKEHEHLVRHRPPREENGQPFPEYEEDYDEAPQDNHNARRTHLQAFNSGNNRGVNIAFPPPPPAPTPAPAPVPVPVPAPMSSRRGSDSRRFNAVFGMRVSASANSQHQEASHNPPPVVHIQAPVLRQRSRTQADPSPRPVTRATAPPVPVQRRPVTRAPQMNLRAEEGFREPPKPVSNRRVHNSGRGSRNRIDEVHVSTERPHSVPLRPARRPSRRPTPRPRVRNQPVRGTFNSLDNLPRSRTPGRRRSGSRTRTIVLTPSIQSSPQRKTITFLSSSSQPVAPLPPPPPSPPKTAITVTSIVNVLRTLPIRHGFRTSYATITTTTFSSSVIHPSQYETTLHPTDPLSTLTVFSRETDPIDPTKVTHIIITTTSLHELKLIPIRIGFSTRTDTQTTVHVLTTLSTVIIRETPFFNFLPQPAPGLQFLTTSNLFVSTETLTSTSVISLIFNGKTLLSTLTSTSLSTTTITQTHAIPVRVTPTSQAPKPLTTLITFHLTGDSGEVTEVVTAITLPLKPVFHTKVERDVRPTSIRTAQPSPSPAPSLFASTFTAPATAATYSREPSLPDFGSGFGFGSGSGAGSGLSKPLLSTSFSIPDESSFKNTITTIFKGPITEIYKASASLVKEVRKHGHKKPIKEDKYATGGFKRRKLHQFGQQFAFNFAPQADFLRDFTRVLPNQGFPSTGPIRDTISDFSELDGSSLAQPGQPQPISNPSQPGFGTRPAAFQRVRINGNTFNRVAVQQPPRQPPSSPVNGFQGVPDNSQFNRFQRVVVHRLPEGTTPRGPSNGFRRLPVFSNQLVTPALPPTPPPPPPQPVAFVTSPPINEDGTRLRVVGADQRPSFRRVRPGSQGAQGTQGSRRVRPVVRVRGRGPSSEATVGPVSGDIPRLTALPQTPQPSSRPTTESTPAFEVTEATLETTTGPVRRVVKIKRPSSQGLGTRRRVVLRGRQSNQPRGPVTRPADEEPSRNNAVDAEEVVSGFGTRLKDETSQIRVNKATANVEPSIPLTYFTTFTYMTTVLRGQHTLVTTRESTTSTVLTQSLDGNLIDLLQNSGGIITPTATVNIGSKVKGPTTTIVNVQSQIHVTNNDLPLILPTLSAAPISNSRKALIEQQPTEPQKVAVKELEALPKTYYTQYTYYYTIVEGSNTRRSTRSEVVTSKAEPFAALASLKLDSTVNSNGFLSLGSGPETVHLGRRSFGKSTTEVNLAMQTFLRFDGISNVAVEASPTAPTAVPDSFNKPTTPLPDNVLNPILLDSSFSPEVPSEPSVSTPEIPKSKTVVRTRRPVRVSSSAVRESTRSRVVINGRPGLRVRVRPGSSRFQLSSTPSIEISSPLPEELISSTPVSVNNQPSLDSSLVTSEDVRQPEEKEPEEREPEVTPTKKRIAVTVRRPFGGLNRLRTRRPANSESTSEPKYIVVTRSGPAGSNRPTSSRFRVASRVFRPSSVTNDAQDISSQFNPESSEIRPTITVNENGETVSIAVTTVAVIFGLETSYRTITMSSTLTPSATPSLATITASPSVPSSPEPSSVIITYFTTTTHTVPYTIGDQTHMTTFELTNSRVATEAVSNIFEHSDAGRANKFMKISDGVTLIVASGVTTSPVTLEPTLVTGPAVVMKDGLMSQLSGLNSPMDTRTLYTTYTFFTTFYSDSTSVISSSEQTVSNVITMPFTQLASLSESQLHPYVEPTQVASTQIEPTQSYSHPTRAEPITIVETMEKIETSTLYSTFTYFATLFNGSQSTITPIEETKTEIITLREPVRITKTIHPTESYGSAPSVFTRTYFTTYTNLVTFFQNDRPVTSTLEETVSNVVTFTLPGFSMATTSIAPTSSVQETMTKSPSSPSRLSTTRSTYTTLTHYITLFSGSQTILSSIEEVSPTVVTEEVGATSRPVENTLTPGANIELTQFNRNSVKSSRDLMTAFVPSISTLFTTHTYYTTLFSGTTSTISSREEVTSSLVTLYVPQTQAIEPSKSSDSIVTMYTTYTFFSTGADARVSSSESTATNHITVEPTPSLPMFDEGRVPTSHVPDQYSGGFFVYNSTKGLSSRSQPQPSLRVESSRFEEVESSIISKVFEDLKSSQGLSDEEISSAIFGSGPGKSTTVIGGSTVVFFTDFILNPSSTQSSVQPTDDNNVAKGPVLNVNSLLDQVDISLLNSLGTTGGHFTFGADSTSILINPSQPSLSTATEAIKPGSVIELSDLLNGSSQNFSGNLGEAIKDIVHLIASGASKMGQKSSTASLQHNIDRLEVSKVTQGGVSFTNSLEPVYIPIGVLANNGHRTSTSSTGKDKTHMLAPVFIPSSQEENKKTTVSFSTNPFVTVSTSSSSSSSSSSNNAQTGSDNSWSPVFKPDAKDQPKPVNPHLISPTTARSGSVEPTKASDILDKIESGLESIESSLGSNAEEATPWLPTERTTPSAIFENPKAVFSQVGSGATTIFLADADDYGLPPPSQDHSYPPTRYVTSVESMTRTLTLTTTKVYYTRDSPLTITSVLTTVIPPKTFVSTIIGSRTILGTATEPSKSVEIDSVANYQGEGTTTVTTTTLIFNSITTTVVRTLVIPTAIQPTRPVIRVPSTKAAQRTTKRPVVSFRSPVRTTTQSTLNIRTPGPRKRLPFPSKRPATIAPPSAPVVPGLTPGLIPVTKIKSAKTVPMLVVDDDQCTPACNSANKELCRETSGKFRCECRSGFARKEGSTACQEMQSYVLLVRVMKVGDSAASYRPEYSDSQSNEYRKFAKLTKEQIDRAYGLTDVKENYLWSDVTGINMTADDGEGVLVNLTVHLASDESLNEDLLRDELIKSLEEEESLPSPASFVAEVEDLMDFDECSHESFNDCHSAALCINEPGTYRCKCKGIYRDMDHSLPGRVCASEVKGCDLCNGRGDCTRDLTGDITTCKCQRMYLGRYCEINGILAAVLSIISVCCIVYCCRKYKKRTNISKGFRNMASFGPATIGAGTLDRKAMLETSSETSDHYRGGGHVYDGPGAVPQMEPGSNGSTPRRRRGSEPSLDRSLGPSGGSFATMPPQVVIPRARHPNQPFSPEPEALPSRYRSRPTSRQSSVISERRQLAPQMVPQVLQEPSSGRRYRKHHPSNNSLRSRGSRISYGGDLIQWAPDETASVVSRSASAVFPNQTSPERKGPLPPRMGFNHKHGWEWQMKNRERDRDLQRNREMQRERDLQRERSRDRDSRCSRPFSPAYSQTPGGANDTRYEAHHLLIPSKSALTSTPTPAPAPAPVSAPASFLAPDARAPMSEAGRSYDETVIRPPMKLLRPGYEYAEGRTYKGWSGNRGGLPTREPIPERAESELSYSASFLTSPPQRYTYPEDRVSLASRKSYYSNTNWGMLPFYDN